jgi:Fibronectin type II domain
MFFVAGVCIKDPSCVFPFVYKNKTYMGCTGDGVAAGSCWCSQDATYSSRYVYCSQGMKVILKIFNPGSKIKQNLIND